MNHHADATSTGQNGSHLDSLRAQPRNYGTACVATLEWLVLCAGLLLAACMSSEKPDSCRLPFRTQELRLGMTKAELKSRRPRTHWSESVQAYQEDVPDLLPFASRVEYRFEGDRLVELLYVRYMTALDGVDQLSRVVAGVVRGATHLWGDPSACVSFDSELGAGTMYESQAIFFDQRDCGVTIRYTPDSSARKAVSLQDQGVPIGITISVATTPRADAIRAPFAPMQAGVKPIDCRELVDRRDASAPELY